MRVARRTVVIVAVHVDNVACKEREKERERERPIRARKRGERRRDRANENAISTPYSPGGKT